MSLILELPEELERWLRDSAAKNADQSGSIRRFDARKSIVAGN